MSQKTKTACLEERIAALEAALAAEIAARQGTQGRTVFERATGDEAAVDICTNDFSGNLTRLGIPDPIVPGQLVFVTYTNSGGHKFTCTSFVISGTYTRLGVVDGTVMLNILPPSNNPAMLGLWNDVGTSIVARSANIPPNESYFIRRYDWATSDGSNPAKAENLVQAVQRFGERMDGKHEWHSRSGLKAVIDCGEGPPDAECDAGFYLQMIEGGKVWLRRNGEWIEL